MGKTISITEAAAWINERDNFLLLTHKRPDGDTLGSAGALVQGLREMGKTAYLLTNTEATPRYSQFVDDYWVPNGFEPEFVIAVDTASLDLLPKNALTYRDNISLCIDHHSSNAHYAIATCSYSEYAACGEIIYEILMQIADGISAKTAECLYVAISTDTGCFSYANTTSNTHKIASQLIKAGASNNVINKMLFRTKTPARIKIDGLVISGMEFLFSGKVAIVTVTREMMRSSEATEDDVDDVANVASSIEGVGIGITIREMSSELDCKISVRTTAPYDASEICKKFGGGGHANAAGASLKKTVGEIRKELLDILPSFISLGE